MASEHFDCIMVLYQPKKMHYFSIFRQGGTETKIFLVFLAILGATFFIQILILNFLCGDFFNKKIMLRFKKRKICIVSDSCTAAKLADFLRIELQKINVIDRNVSILENLKKCLITPP